MICSKNQILVLGAGYVAPPCVQHLCKNPKNFVTVASRTIDKANKIVKAVKTQNCKAVELDIQDTAALEKLVSECDLVVSLIPYIHHPKVYDASLKHGKHVVTTSYVSPTLKLYDERVKAKGLCFFNEIGVDPGVDHLYAIKIIHEAHKNGGKIKSFTSYCGGLPSLKDSHNPLRYRFSWSARGVLQALKNDALYLENGKEVYYESKNLMDACVDVEIDPSFKFIGYPNRNSVNYSHLYAIPEAQTVLRGTLRYPEIKAYLQLFNELDMISDTPLDLLDPAGKEPLQWRTLLCQFLKIQNSTDEDIKDSLSKLKCLSDKTVLDRVFTGLKSLGIVSSDLVEKKGNMLDTLAMLLEKKMSYEPGQVDMIALKHTFVIDYPDKTQTVDCSAVWEGEKNGFSAMAKCVGIPCAITVQLILDGKIKKRGVLAPLDWELAEPIMHEIEKEGIKMKETVL